MPSFKSEKLRVNLRLCINRLKLLEKKKAEVAMKARREIADYLKNKRTERARIRTYPGMVGGAVEEVTSLEHNVSQFKMTTEQALIPQLACLLTADHVEHIIREDYMVEAMEVIELYCDLLLARFGMLEQMTYCEDSLAETVATLIWVAPRLCADVQELSQVAHQLENKFGKPFAQQARSNLSGTVNAKVIHRLSAEAPKKSLVENYMIEIARNYKIDYEPDPSMFLEDDGIPVADSDPYTPDQAGALPQKDERYTQAPGIRPSHPPPSHPPPSQPRMNQGPPPGPPAYTPSYPPTQPPPGPNPGLPYPTAPQPGVQPPSIPVDNLNLPQVPNTTFPSGGAGGAGGSGDVDFDDLTRRFEELKKRK